MARRHCDRKRAYIRLNLQWMFISHVALDSAVTYCLITARETVIQTNISMVKDINYTLTILCVSFCRLLSFPFLAAPHVNLSSMKFAPETLDTVFRLYLALNSYCYLGITKFGVSGDSTTGVTSNSVAVVSERRIDA
ncbi:hypothetical protein BKA69DRAFT_1042796 [Paraphysoderma sedebokerense]|nr:hypothetical protein BKA69DRAFT_1042796 [Paraphysoderma sedebokerense]